MKSGKVSWVSSKVGVRKSKTHDCGLFAKKAIGKGEAVVVQGGRIAHKLWNWAGIPRKWWYHCDQIEESFYICPISSETVDGVFLLNHSCNPNVGFKDSLTLAAMRRIMPGEEVCYDYAMSDSSAYTDMSCHCGSKKCRGVITHNDWKTPELQRRYKNCFSPYLRKIIASRGKT